MKHPTQDSTLTHSNDTSPEVHDSAAVASSRHSSSLAASMTSVSSLPAKNATLSRRIQQVLAVQIDDGMKDLSREFDEIRVMSGASSAVSGEQDGEPNHPCVFRLPSTYALRSSIESQVLSSHQRFLEDFAVLHDTFQQASQQLADLEQTIEQMESTLHPCSSSLKEFVEEMRSGQAALRDVEERETQMQAIWDQLNFQKEDQELLHRGPVDAYFLEALERARAIYTASRETLVKTMSGSSARAYDVGVICYASMGSALRLIAAFLIQPAVVKGDTSGAVSTVSSMTSDCPDLSRFYLRCVRVLYDYDVASWQSCVKMVSEMRSSSVLRRYCHLLTTGSATTSAGTYHRSLKPVSVASSIEMEKGGSSSLRPLEADYNRPLYFFRAVLAWLHQTIVAECDLLSSFYFKTPSMHVLRSSLREPHVEVRGKDDEEDENYSFFTLSNHIFASTADRIESALSGVLERFVVSANVLPSRSSPTAPHNSSPTSLMSGPVDTVETKRAGLGKRFTFGIQRIWRRSPSENPFSPASVAQALGTKKQILDAFVTASPEQQQLLTGHFLQAPLSALKELFGVLLLFQVYNDTAVVPLLGASGELSKLLGSKGPHQIFASFQKVLEHVSAHLTRSKIILLTYNDRLQQLHEAFLVNDAIAVAPPPLIIGKSRSNPEEGAANGGEKSTTDAGSSKEVDATPLFVTRFLLRYQSVDANVHDNVFKPKNHLYSFLDQKEKTNSADKSVSDSTASVQSSPLAAASKRIEDDPLVYAASLELEKNLSQLILPTSPEVLSMINVMQFINQETIKQQELVVQHKNQAKDNTFDAVPNPGLDSEEESYTLLCWKSMVQRIFSSYWIEIQGPSILATRLDPLCRDVLLLNVLYALQELSPMYPAVLQIPVQEDNTVEGLIEIFTEKVVQFLSAAVICNYFPVNGRKSAEPSQHPVPEAAREALDNEKANARMIYAYREIVFFFDFIKKKGSLYVPLVSSIKQKDARSAIESAVKQNLLESYTTLYNELIAARPATTQVTTEDGCPTFLKRNKNFEEEDELKEGFERLDLYSPDLLQNAWVK